MVRAMTPARRGAREPAGELGGGGAKTGRMRRRRAGDRGQGAGAVIGEWKMKPRMERMGTRGGGPAAATRLDSTSGPAIPALKRRAILVCR